MKNNQSGISGVKVSVFVAVLCAGCLIVAARMQRLKQVNTMMEQIAALGATVKKHSAKISEIIGKYSRNYALFLDKTGNLPDGLFYVNDAIQVANNARINATVDANGVVIMEVSNLDTDSCVKIVTANWEYRQTTQFVGVGIGQAPDFSCLSRNNCKFNYIAAFPGTADYPFTVDRATIPCSLSEKENQPATVYLGYKL